MTVTAIKKEFESLVSDVLASRSMNKIYLFLCSNGPSTSEEIAEGAHIYPSTVRDLLAQMTKEGYIARTTLETKTVGKNPYIYQAVSLRTLVDIHMRRIQTKFRKLSDSDMSESDEMLQQNIK